MFQVFPALPFNGGSIAIQIVHRMTLGTLRLTDFIFKQLNGNTTLCLDRTGGIESYIGAAVGENGLAQDKTCIANGKVVDIAGDFQELTGRAQLIVRILQQAARECKGNRGNA